MVLATCIFIWDSPRSNGHILILVQLMGMKYCCQNHLENVASCDFKLDFWRNDIKSWMTLSLSFPLPHWTLCKDDFYYFSIVVKTSKIPKIWETWLSKYPFEKWLWDILGSDFSKKRLKSSSSKAICLSFLLRKWMVSHLAFSVPGWLPDSFLPTNMKWSKVREHQTGVLPSYSIFGLLSKIEILQAPETNQLMCLQPCLVYKVFVNGSLFFYSFSGTAKLSEVFSKSSRLLRS